MSHQKPLFKEDEKNFSAKKVNRRLNFFCAAPEAKSVSIVGDFNNWDPAANPMERQVDGNWLVQVEMCHGHHHYLFMVDGKPVLDPRASGIGRNERNDRVSLIGVS